VPGKSDTRGAGIGYQSGEPEQKAKKLRLEEDALHTPLNLVDTLVPK
jgi:hypothetical protein